VEVAHYLIDHTTPRQFGNIAGQIIYECVEDAIISLAIAGVTATGIGSPVGAGGGAAWVAQKAIKITRIIHRLSQAPGLARSNLNRNLLMG
jgi:hypothetical protein